MTHHHLTIEAFVKLGDFLRSFCEFIISDNNSEHLNDEWTVSFKTEIEMNLIITLQVYW